MIERSYDCNTSDLNEVLLHAEVLLEHYTLTHAHLIIVHACNAGTIQVLGLFCSAQARELVQEQFKGKEDSRKYSIHILAALHVNYSPFLAVFISCVQGVSCKYKHVHVVDPTHGSAAMPSS